MKQREKKSTIMAAACLLSGGMLMAMTEKDRALVSVAAETARGNLVALECAFALSKSMRMRMPTSLTSRRRISRGTRRELCIW